MTATRRSARTGWMVLKDAWKGAVGLGTLGWAGYGTVASTVFGHSPGWDGDAAFACAGALGALLSVEAGRVSETVRRAPSRP